jgi:hypothetical protein
MRRSLLAILLILLVLCTGSVNARADEVRIMVLPVEAPNLEFKEDLAAFTTLLQEYFGDRQNVELLSEDQLESLLGSTTGNQQQLIRVAGEKLNCQAALLITLERFRERLGDEYSASEPASLAFEYRLVGTSDGKLLCYGQFDETQQPVSENVLAIGKAIRRGFKWITVAELAREGLRGKFESCPALSPNTDSAKSPAHLR